MLTFEALNFCDPDDLDACPDNEECVDPDGDLDFTCQCFSGYFRQNIKSRPCVKCLFGIMYFTNLI